MHRTAQGGATPLSFITISARHDEAGTLHVVARAKQGDHHAVRQLYSRYAPAVRLYAASLLQDADAVEDVVQTTFLKLLTKLDRYEPRDVPFEAWLLRVARNAAYDELRRRRSRETLPMLEHDGARTAPESEPLEVLPAALEEIPPSWREVLVLRHVVGLSVEEVSARLGTSVQAVAAVHDRACACLRAALARAADAPPPRRERVRGALVQQIA